MNKNASLEKIQSWAKRKGFVFPCSEIYGGLANSWDYGPYGVMLKNNIRDSWWERFVEQREDVVGLDSSIILNPTVWEASGHVASFKESLVDCKTCKYRTAAEKLVEEATGMVMDGKSLDELNSLIIEKKIKCPKCGNINWTEARKFNTLFETTIGIVESSKSKAYLRGETAQGIFVNFKPVTESMRVRVPFGIAQVGKAFRNEITKGQFTFRTLEFEQMEIEYFIHPQADWESIFESWMNELTDWYESVGISKENMRQREHGDDERSFYSKKTVDLEYEFDFGWKELYGQAYRTDYDLSKHAEFSGKDLSYRDPQTGEKYIPHVVEPSTGLSRAMLCVLYDAYTEEDLGDGKMRTVMKFAPRVAPIKAAILPLQKDENLRAKSREIYENLKKSFVVEYDDSGSIGKSYRRQDEIGTPLCVTIDFDSLEDGEVTVRDRDTMKQERIKIEELERYIAEKVK